MRIDIWSDMVCPWCYLGHRRFELALEELADDGVDTVDVRWHAFELDPDAPAEPGDLRAVIERKYGPGAFDGMTGRLTALGAADGLEYRFDLAQRVNTFDAHRLTALAATHGADRQDRMLRRLFRAYFTEGADVSDHGVLAGLAELAELDRDGAAAVLDGDAHAEEVLADGARARAADITGVPAFVLDERALIPGAQDTATMVRFLSRQASRT